MSHNYTNCHTVTAGAICEVNSIEYNWQQGKEIKLLLLNEMRHINRILSAMMISCIKPDVRLFDHDCG